MRYNSQALSDFTVTFPKRGKQNNNKKQLKNACASLPKVAQKVAGENNVAEIPEPAACSQQQPS